MRRSVVSLLAAAVVGLGAASVSAASTPIGHGVTASEPAVRWPEPVSPPSTTEPPPPAYTGRSLLISDSAWLGMQYYAGVDQVQGFEHILSLASCRRRVATSCENYNGFVPITLYENLEQRADSYETLIVATGYNDSDNRFTGDVDDIVTLARSKGIERVVWLTLRSNVTYTSPGNAGFAEVFERSNSTLKQIEAAGTYPELVVADWGDYAHDEPDWFSSDGIHLRNEGAYAAGDYISRKMAFLDGRACPQPSYAGVAPLDPCPDPDEHGAVIDLDSLYPIGQRDPDQRFTLEYEGSSSWPDPPWWEA